jgi:hypothetical protein
MRFTNSFDNYTLSDYFIAKQQSNKLTEILILKEGDSVIIKETIDKYIRHRDPVRIKLSIPKSTRIVHTFGKENDIRNIQITIQEGEIKFDKPNFLTIINYTPFLKFCKDSIIALQIFGVVYFSYKIITNLINLRKKKEEFKKESLAISDK